MTEYSDGCVIEMMSIFGPDCAAKVLIRAPEKPAGPPCLAHSGYTQGQARQES